MLAVAATGHRLPSPRHQRFVCGFGCYDAQNRRQTGAGPGQPGRLSDQRGQGGVRDAPAQGRRRALRGRHAVRRRLPGHVRRRRGRRGTPTTRRCTSSASPGCSLPGQYQVKLLSPATAVSPGFTIGDGTQLYGQLVDNAVRYFTSERDGPDVDAAVLGRQPANLTDEKAYVYADPSYDGNDNLLGTLKKTGGPVDVSGGWFDAGGGYEKFGYTASYADALMLLAARASSNQQGPGSYDMLARRRRSACSGSPSCGTPPARCSTRRSGSAPATPATRSRATTTSGSCPRRRTG